MSFNESLDDLVAENRNGLVGKAPTWQRVRLGDAVDVLNGFPFESSQFTTDPSEGLPLVRIRDVTRGSTSTYYAGPFESAYVVQPGDLLVGMDGDFNSATWRGAPSLLNQRVCKLSVRSSGVVPKFLSYALPGYLSAINARTSSITVKHLSSRTIEDIPLALPPRSEQARISDLLDELFSDLDAGIEALERTKTKLTLYRASVLKAAVDGSLTADWRVEHPSTESASALLQRILVERRRRWEEDQLARFTIKEQEPPRNWKAKYKEPVAPAVQQLPALPKGWCWASLDQLADIAGGVTKGQKFSESEKTRMVPYLRVANVQQGHLDLSQMKEIRASEADIAALRLVPGDVLFNEGGDRDKLGRGWIWEGQLPECVHQNHVFRARPYMREIESRLLSWCGNSYGREWFSKAGKQSVNLASINLTVLRSFPVALAPAVEQVAIAEAVDTQLSVIDHTEADIDSRLQAAQSLRQAILRHAFSGQLVPQDPNDEPATVLLARIAAERAAREQAAAHARTTRRAPRRTRRLTARNREEAPA